MFCKFQCPEVDWDETRKKFDEAMLMPKKVANNIGINKSTFSQILNGRYPSAHSKRVRAVVQKLDELGVLVCREREAA